MKEQPQEKGIRRDGNGYRVYVRVGSVLKEKRFPLDATPKEMTTWRDAMRGQLHDEAPEGIGKHQGIRATPSGIRAYVRVGKVFREKQFTADTPIREIKIWRESMKTELRKAQPKVVRGGFKTDALAYLESPRRKQKAGFGAKRSELKAWMKEFKDRPRAGITEQDVEKVRDKWILEGFAPKTINHRVRAARQMTRELDGEHIATPWDKCYKTEHNGGERLTVPETIPTFVDPKTIQKVAKNLAAPKASKLVRRKKDGVLVPLGNRMPSLELARLDQARFLVLAATGQRPAQLKRAEIDDITFASKTTGLWLVRPAKGGKPIPVVLNVDMTIALRHLLKLGGIGGEIITPKRGKPRRRGDFDSSDYAKRLYRAGWPETVKPYNLKHSIGMALADAGVDMELIADYYGHKDTRTARIYTTIRTKRLKIASDALAATRPLGISNILKPVKAKVVTFRKKAS